MKKTKLNLVLFALIIMINIFLICQKDTEKITLDEVKLKESSKDGSMFAIMLQKDVDSAEYEQSIQDTWPIEGYIFNQEKSGCLDSAGKKITDVKLSYTDGKVKVETGNTSYCYIYFDKEDPGAPGKELAKEKLNDTIPLGFNPILIGDLYRFQGIQGSVDNYICFGNTTCVSGDDHMYRIIGIDTSGKIKIMKEKIFGLFSWDSNYKSDIHWNTSQLKSNINGSSFLNNSTYIPQDTNWKTLIDDTIKWKYGDVTSSEINTTGPNLYQIEQSWQDTVTASIGLIYLSDYYLSYSDDINCSSSGNYTTCKTSWMHQSSNGDTSNNQWTMSREGPNSSGGYCAWRIMSAGYIGGPSINGASAIAPVFYLKSTVKITGGDGKKGSPFTITP